MQNDTSCLFYLQFPVSLDFIDKLFFNYYYILKNCYFIDKLLLNCHRVKNAKFLYSHSMEKCICIEIRCLSLLFETKILRNCFNNQNHLILTSTPQKLVLKIHRNFNYDAENSNLFLRRQGKLLLTPLMLSTIVNVAHKGLTRH